MQHTKTPRLRSERIHALDRALRERILVMDGAMGTMLQRHELSEEDFRGERFENNPVSLEGANDLLCLSRPALIRSIHSEFLLAGADPVS